MLFHNHESVNLLFLSKLVFDGDSDLTKTSSEMLQMENVFDNLNLYSVFLMSLALLCCTRLIVLHFYYQKKAYLRHLDL